MKVKILIDEKTAKEACKIANDMGISLSQLIKNYLGQLTKKEQSNNDFNDFLQLSGQGNSQGWKFDREELNEKRSL